MYQQSSGFHVVFRLKEGSTYRHLNKYKILH